MRKSRFTEKQIIGILREQEAAVSTADVCRKHGISSATLFKRKSEFGGMEVSDARRLKALEDENAKVNRFLAEAMPGNAMLKDLNSKNGDARCEAASGGTSCGTSRGEPAAGVQDQGAIRVCRRNNLRHRTLETRDVIEQIGLHLSPLFGSLRPFRDIIS